MLGPGLQTTDSKPVLYFVYQMEQFHQRNLLGMLASVPRTKDESFALSLGRPLCWLMLIRGWCWHGTCTSGMWITAPTEGEARKALATRSLRLFPGFPIDYPFIQQTFVSFFNSGLPMELIARHISKPTASVVFSHCPLPGLFWFVAPGFHSSSLALCSLGPVLLLLIVVVPGSTCFERLPRHSCPPQPHSSPRTVICLSLSGFFCGYGNKTGLAESSGFYRQWRRPDNSTARHCVRDWVVAGRS